MSRPVVAIDGPAGSGKSTVARLLARRLGFTHIDTGALYRGIAYLALQAGADLGEEVAVLRAARGRRLEFRQLPEGNLLHIDGVCVNGEIRSERVSMGASVVSALPGVRAHLLELQRELGRSGAVVLEGRDIGTVVFPDARVKVFLTASLEARARRRAGELLEKGENAGLEVILAEMSRRDEQDSRRATAPLRQAEDAVLVDTSTMSVDSVLDRLESLVRERS